MFMQGVHDIVSVRVCMSLYGLFAISQLYADIFDDIC